MHFVTDKSSFCPRSPRYMGVRAPHLRNAEHDLPYCCCCPLTPLPLRPRLRRHPSFRSISSFSACLPQNSSSASASPPRAGRSCSSSPGCWASLAPSRISASTAPSRPPTARGRRLRVASRGLSGPRAGKLRSRLSDGAGDSRRLVHLRCPES